jgi:hypothetical protein
MIKFIQATLGKAMCNEVDTITMAVALSIQRSAASSTSESPMPAISISTFKHGMPL